MRNLSIGQVATAANVRPSAVRYYEAEGLLPQPSRRSGKRVYDQSILNRLALIRLAAECGFSIAEIRTLLHGFAGDTPPPKRWHSLAQSKLEELNERMAQFSRMKRVLMEICRCKCVSIEQCGVHARRRAPRTWRNGPSPSSQFTA